jgi:hypothetical protein
MISHRALETIDISALRLTSSPFPAKLPLQEKLSLRYVMSRQLHHSRSRATTVEKPRFLLEAGELEAGL